MFKKLDKNCHTHGNACGHKAVHHGDHIDYLHDGHILIGNKELAVFYFPIGDTRHQIVV